MVMFAPWQFKLSFKALFIMWSRLVKCKNKSQWCFWYFKACFEPYVTNYFACRIRICSAFILLPITISRRIRNQWNICWKVSPRNGPWWEIVLLLPIRTLNPGTYTLWVRSSNPESLSSPISMEIVVKPPFYASNWVFLLLCPDSRRIVYYLMRMYQSRVKLQASLTMNSAICRYRAPESE